MIEYKAKVKISVKLYEFQSEQTIERLTPMQNPHLRDASILLSFAMFGLSRPVSIKVALRTVFSAPGVVD